MHYRLVGVVGDPLGRNVPRHGDHRGASRSQCGPDRRLHDRPGLSGVDEPTGVERCDLERRVRIDLFERAAVDQARYGVAHDRDHRDALTLSVHQPVDQMRGARP